MMTAIGYVTVWVGGALLSFLLTVLIAGMRVRGGLETFPMIIGLGVMAAIIWVVAFSVGVHP